MMRIGSVPLFLVALAWPAAAQETPRDFPVDKQFKGVSISGYDVQKFGLTLTVARDGNRLKGSGSTGCNSWTATVVIREDQIDVSDIITTKKHCGRGMNTEQAFLTTLQSAHRWRVDGQKLILEGEAARLLLTSSGSDKAQDSKPVPKSAKKPARKPARG